MKYTRLTKEQFEEMQQEFINFLASQSITADEWQTIKTNTPDVADQELDVFSDLVWEGVLNNVIYLENISQKHMYLFYFEEKRFIPGKFFILSICSNDRLCNNPFRLESTRFDCQKPISSLYYGDDNICVFNSASLFDKRIVFLEVRLEILSRIYFRGINDLSFLIPKYKIQKKAINERINT